MQRRLFCPILAAAVLLTALAGGADRASAAIRITISDGTTDKVFYSADSQSALFLTDLGAFDIMLQSTASNFPGLATGGTLSQIISLSDLNPTGSTLPTFHFTSAVIDDVAGVSDGLVSDAQRPAVMAAELRRFTLPAASMLDVSSSVAAADPSLQPDAGTVQNVTNVNGVDVASTAVDVNTTEPATHEIVGNDPSEGYTLSSHVILAGANVGVSGLSINADSVVNAHSPEPGSMVVWALGGLGLALAGATRRRLARPKV